jgi:hypothetical protein
MTFFVYPTGSVSHLTALQARDSAVPSAPFIDEGLDIVWRINGVEIDSKNGLTTEAFARNINTGNPGDFDFDATHTGKTIDFVIDGTTVSAGVVLSNNLPTIESAGFIRDASNIIPRGTPRFTWTYADADGDPMYFFRLMVGTSPGAGDIYDSGILFGSPGDVNNDGIVDNVDSQLVSEAFGATREGTSAQDEKYALELDLDRDGEIGQTEVDLVDLFLGEQYSISPTSSTFAFNIPATLPEGTIVHWTLQVGDGEQTNPADPEWPEPSRKTVQATGFGPANSRPIVSSVKIDGV